MPKPKKPLTAQVITAEALRLFQAEQEIAKIREKAFKELFPKQDCKEQKCP